MTGGHMAVMLVRVEQELWFPGVPLASIIHVSEGRTATQPMFGYRKTYFSLRHVVQTSTDV